jgi:hypothetical protein
VGSAFRRTRNIEANLPAFAKAPARLAEARNARRRQVGLENADEHVDDQYGEENEETELLGARRHRLNRVFDDRSAGSRKMRSQLIGGVRDHYAGVIQIDNGLSVSP